MTNEELAAALVWVDNRLRYTGTSNDYYKPYLKHLNDLLAEQVRRASQPTTGIHPAKFPMEGGFSLEKFMPGLKPEDADAFGKALESADSLEVDPWIGSDMTDEGDK
jgi:hypothetical protein